MLPTLAIHIEPFQGSAVLSVVAIDNYFCALVEHRWFENLKFNHLLKGDQGEMSIALLLAGDTVR